MGAESGGEMCSGRKAEDADPVRIDVPFRGMLAHDAKGALRVLQGGGRFGIRACVGHAIFYEDAGDADGVEPVADLGAFEIDGEDLIASAGKDHHGSAGVLLGWRIEGERGAGDVAEAKDRTSGDEIGPLRWWYSLRREDWQVRRALHSARAAK